MSGRDLLNNLSIEQIIDPVVGTVTILSTEVDLQKFGSASFLAAIGETGDTLSGSVMLECELQHTDTTGSGYVAVPDAEITNAVPSSTAVGTFGVIDAAADDDTLYETQYLGNKRFLKVNLRFTGTHTNGMPVAVISMKSGPKYPPVA